MKHFVEEGSIVRKIWGKSDTVLFIFAGASAEFALNKAVDWLYFTGRLPTDPLGRLFSTVAYAGKIIYSPYDKAIAAIDNITAIHKNVEGNRGGKIPDWAYRDVLYMLIDYSIKAHETLENQLTEEEKEEVYNVFYRVGNRMEITGLPNSYQEWLPSRKNHLQDDLARSRYTEDLYKQYKKHLGTIRFWLLLQVQKILCPPRVLELLQLKANPFIPPALVSYKFGRWIGMDHILKILFLPTEYKQQIAALDRKN